MKPFMSPTIHGLRRCALAHLPTPVEEMKSLSAALGGPRLLIKRDDQTGLAFGGNKTRKLEFLMADALAQGATTIVTAGAAQSNHCRQTVAAAARLGLKCELVLGGEEPDHLNGNLLLDHLMGARIHWTTMEGRVDRMREIALTLGENGEQPYVIPYGGSNAVGATGYVLAMIELMEQLQETNTVVHHIVFASSSGGTQAGVVVGAKLAGFEGSLLGISIDKGERGPRPFEEELMELGNETARRTGLKHVFSHGDFRVDYGYLGGGYGVVGDLEREAIKLVAKSEGILLDPVYTGRAMGALLAMIPRGFFSRDETVLFWHTGGAPALFAYERELGLRGKAER
jgi:L-cysteate sulfo-lyase